MKGNQTLSCVCDPQGVGTGLTTYPRVFGTAPLDLWLRNGHPQGVPAPTNPARQVPDPAYITLYRWVEDPAFVATYHRPADPAFIALYRRGGGSRQGSTLHSHRSSRHSGDDLWTDHRPDPDPLRVALIIPLWTAIVTPTSPLFITSFSQRKRGSLYFAMR